MQPLQLNSSGADVVQLQEKLKALGFNPGKIDGDFGTGTEAAVIAFQRSEGLLADGIVGLKTLRALGFEPTPEAVAADSVLPQVTVGVVSRMFPLTPLDNIKKHLPAVLDALKKQDLTDRNMVLMALSTIRAETAGFKPIDEGKSRFNTSPGGNRSTCTTIAGIWAIRGRPTAIGSRAGASSSSPDAATTSPSEKSWASI